MRNNLIKWEKEQGYKANYVAKRLGVTEAMWSRIKHGFRNPNYNVLAKFQKEFEPEDIITLFAED